MTAVQRTCLKCGRPVVKGVGDGMKFRCDSCDRHERLTAPSADEMAERIKVERERRFAVLCPPTYLATDPSKIPNRKAFDRAMGWKFGARGLVLHGSTGQGKTRAAWALLRRLYVHGGRGFEAMSSTRFAHEVGKRFGEHTGEEWIEQLEGADILFIDDLGKFKLTERVEVELFHLVEERTANGKPILVTANMEGDSVKLSENKASPLLRRVREFCDSIKF